MATKADIFNMALAHLGHTKGVTDPDTDTTKEASVLRLFYSTAKKIVMKDFDWPFATQFVELTELDTDPTEEWAYSYEWPENCLKIRRLMSGDRMDTPGERIEFRIVGGTDDREIYTDEEDANAEITIDIEEEDSAARYTEEFVLQFSRYLAYLAAPSFLGGDNSKFAQTIYQQYLLDLSQAKALSANESPRYNEQDCDLITARR